MKCFDCNGEGEYSFPEASGMDMSDGWYKCGTCRGTGQVARFYAVENNKCGHGFNVVDRKTGRPVALIYDQEHPDEDKRRSEMVAAAFSADEDD